MSVSVCVDSGFRKRAEGAHQFGIRCGHERRRRECAEVNKARGNITPREKQPQKSAKQLMETAGMP